MKNGNAMIVRCSFSKNGSQKSKYFFLNKESYYIDIKLTRQHETKILYGSFKLSVFVSEVQGVEY